MKDQPLKCHFHLLMYSQIRVVKCMWISVVVSELVFRGEQYLLWVTVRYWDVTGTEVCSESPERQARDPPKNLSNLTTTMFDLSQCKHCVCMRWREKRRCTGWMLCISKGNPLFYSSDCWTSHSHTTQHTRVCAHNTGCRMRGDLSSPTFTDAQRAVRFKYGRRHTLVLTHQSVYWRGYRC